MAGIAIMAIILGFGIPSFQQFMANQKVRNASYDLFTSLNMARSEATKRAGDVTVVATNPANWAAGWKVMTGTVALPGVDLFVRDPLPTDVAIEAPLTLGSVTFKSSGRLAPSAPPNFTFKSTTYPTLATRCLIVDVSGKAISGC